TDGIDPDQRDSHGDTVLTRLLLRGVDGIVAAHLLLQRGASPAGAGVLSRFLAACAPNEEASATTDGLHAAESLALDLLERGADPFAAHPGLETPVLQALRMDWPRLFDALLARGADPQT